jgi:hypothetical protein
MPVIPVTQGVEAGGSPVQDQPQESEGEPISKTIQTKELGT